MNGYRKLMAVLLGIILVLGAAKSVPAYAAEAKTWYVTYDVNTSGWYESTDKVNWSSASLSKFAAGDSIVIDACSATSDQLKLTAYQAVNEVAFINGANAVLTAPSVKHAYAISGATGVINADVESVDAYYTGIIQVNGNVGSFTAHYSDDSNVNTVFAVTGTVDKANVKSTKDLLSNNTTLYNIAKGKLVTNDQGYVALKDGEYSLTASESASASETGLTANLISPSSEKVLDDVPKTGDSYDIKAALAFFTIAATCVIGALIYEKKKSTGK
jgi:hypothetical protein